jgi:hypothetical protein
MKKLFLVVMAAVLALGSISLAAQDVECIILKHSTEAAQLKNDIQKCVAKGYIPEGMTYDGDELYVMYLKEPDVKMTEWVLEWYDDTKELRTGLDSHTKKGFIPAGITAAESQIFVLYTKEEGTNITGYSFVPTSWETMEDDLADDVEEGYVPYGIAVMNDGKYYALMITAEDFEISEWMVEEYKTGEHQDAIDANIEEGYIPVGFEAGDEVVHVLYIMEEE